MIKIELDLPEIRKAVEQYLQSAFSVPVSVSDLKVNAGRSNSEARIELSLNTDVKTYDISKTDTDMMGIMVGESSGCITEEEDEDEAVLAETALNSDIGPVDTKSVDMEPKAETAAPLVDEVKTVPPSFFNRAANS